MLCANSSFTDTVTGAVSSKASRPPVQVQSTSLMVEPLIVICTLPEESAFYHSIGKDIAAVCIRTSTERPEALDKGAFVLAGISAEQVLQAVDLAVSMLKNGDLCENVPVYTEDVSNKVVKLIQSYTGVVNKMVWRKF